MKSLQVILRNKKYIGYYKWRDIEIEGGIQSIVDKEIFQIVQNRLNSNKMAANRKHEQYLLTTKLFCGICGSTMVGESGKGRNRTYRYYKCIKRKNKGECAKKTVKKDWLEDLVVNETINNILHNNIINLLVESVIEFQEKEYNNSIIKLLENNLKDVNFKINNLIKTLESGIHSESIVEKLKILESQKDEIKSQIFKENVESPILTKPQILFFLKQFKNKDYNNIECRKDLINTFINSIYLYDDKIIITYNYIKSDGYSLKSILDLNGSDLENYGYLENNRKISERGKNKAETDVFQSDSTLSFMVHLFYFVLKLNYH